MARQTVYIETTIPSIYCERRPDPSTQHMREATRGWWTRAQDEFSLVTSGFVLAELDAAPEPVRSDALALLQDILVLPIPRRFDEVVSTYIVHRLMPADDRGDAAHLAVATLFGCDFLVTWNCRHLANARKARHIEAVNRLLGLPSPLLVTPEQLA